MNVQQNCEPEITADMSLGRVPLIDPNLVYEAFRNCFFTDAELEACGGKPAEFVEVSGVMTNVGFHPCRLEEKRKQVRTWLEALPNEFKTGGDTFLNICHDKNGELWTGVHRTCDELIMLGIGLGLIKVLTPEEGHQAFNRYGFSAVWHHRRWTCK